MFKIIINKYQNLLVLSNELNKYMIENNWLFTILINNIIEDLKVFSDNQINLIYLIEHQNIYK